MKEILEWNQFRFKTKYSLHPFPNTIMPSKMQFYTKETQKKEGRPAWIEFINIY